MARSPLDLTGNWSGRFRYPHDLGPVTPFLANIAEQGGSFTGTIVEPHMLLPGVTALASIVGVRSGRSIDFTKTYEPGTEDYHDPVDYVGSLSDDGRTITGMWCLQDMNGRFEMSRDKEADEAAAQDAAIAAPLTEAIKLC